MSTHNHFCGKQFSVVGLGANAGAFFLFSSTFRWNYCLVAPSSCNPRQVRFALTNQIVE
jgi:hypothetical protein